jgi:hypothetical protein
MMHCRRPFLKRPRIKKREWFVVSQKEPNGGKPNRNHHCEEENDAAFGPVHGPALTARCRRSH